MASNTVIIFGPTGNIGSVAARTAHELGAKVVLAMRDPQKAIPGLSTDEEKGGSFERVQADLTQPDTVREAVQKTGAKRAYFYLAHGMPDGMKSTVQALKSAGIEFVVFLSSYTIDTRDVRDVEPTDLIPYIHAQVELNLQEIFGKEHYVGIRPGAFATNTLWWTHGVQTGNVKLPYPDVDFDYISYLDMGRVSGSILVNGKQDEEYYVFLCGPQMVSQRDAVGVISNALNKKLEITPLYNDDAVEFYKTFAPEPLAKYLIKKYNEMVAGTERLTAKPWYEESMSNVKKYGGKPPQPFEEWVEQNKHRFEA